MNEDELRELSEALCIDWYTEQERQILWALQGIVQWLRSGSAPFLGTSFDFSPIDEFIVRHGFDAFQERFGVRLEWYQSWGCPWNLLGGVFDAGAEDPYED